MKKQNINRKAIIACVALCAALWHWSAGVNDLSVEPIKTAVISGIEAWSEKMQPNFLSDDIYASGYVAVAENEPSKTDIEKETPIPTSTHETKPQEASPISSMPRMGDVRVVNGENQIYIDSFGWVKDEGHGAKGTMVGNLGDKLTGNKIGQMGGGVTVHGKGDINKQVGIMGTGDALASNSDLIPGTKKYIDGKLHVWVSGFGWIEYSGKQSVAIIAKDMYENGHKIGSMEGSEVPPRESAPPPSEQLEPIDGELHIVFVEVPEKNSTPPPYKPDTVSP